MISSRRSDESVKLPATLTGLNLAISIAREATDAVPVVKQTLGAAVRILALAEKIEKDREALHALADRSLQLAQRVKDVMDGRRPDEKILASFERINRAFDSIETFMAKHIRRTRLRRAIGYVFTVSFHVERLSRELADAVQELVLVALLDVNHEAHATRELVEENARYVGEFRLLRHCDVEKLEPIEYHWHSSDIGIRYHRARVDGQLAVVRYFKQTEAQDPRFVQCRLHWSADYERMMAHDRIIEELSTVQRSHRNVARIYGWSRGSSLDRFMVFKSGYRDVNDVLKELPDPVTTGIHWAFKVLVENNGLMSPASYLKHEQDAVYHLDKMGISWSPTFPDTYTLDAHLEPIIGLWNDLSRIDGKTTLSSRMNHYLHFLPCPVFGYSTGVDVPATDVLAALSGFHHEPLAFVVAGFNVITRGRYVISKGEFPHARMFTDGTAEGLLQMIEEDRLDRTWDSILLAVNRNQGHRVTNSVQVFYTTFDGPGDILEIFAVQEDSDRIVYDRYMLRFLRTQCHEVREILSVPAPSKENRLECRTIAIGGPGTYRAPK